MKSDSKAQGLSRKICPLLLSVPPYDVFCLATAWRTLLGEVYGPDESILDPFGRANHRAHSSGSRDAVKGRSKPPCK